VGQQPRNQTDPPTLIASLSRDKVSLELNTYDLCCLAGLYLRADKQALACFAEEELVDLFEQVCEVVEPGADNPRKRATHAIQRLRDQRMLHRVDGAGLIRAGDFGISRLAAAVVEFYLTDEQLTRESLALLTRTLASQLVDIRKAAEQAETDEAWRDHVAAPLQVTVGDLVAGIERRQRGLDAAQEEVQGKISDLLQEDWFGAITQSEELLDQTTSTLNELNEVLMSDVHQLTSLLQEILALADNAEQDDAQEATQRVQENLDRITAWGRARQATWSEFYQNVHRYLRDVVRLDPDRALSQRLRDQITGWSQRPFYLVTTAAPSIRRLRAVEHRVERPPVTRPTGPRDKEPEDVDSEDRQRLLEDLVREALEAGETELSAITTCVLAQLPQEHAFGTTGRIAAIVADLARPRSARERAWVPVVGGLEIEQWTLDHGLERRR
jgi:chromosome partition protein MukF